MKILLDTDVLLDVANGRERFGPESRTVLRWCQSSHHSTVLAWHTLSNLYYLLRPTKGDKEARTFITGLLVFSEVAATSRESARQALALAMHDFEDALQVAAATVADAQFIVTRNVRDYRGSPVPAITPHDFIRRFLST
ncbi:MAG: type II toxin-antitoxin system VapC family toxin [Chthoniobacterales bacterium]